MAFFSPWRSSVPRGRCFATARGRNGDQSPPIQPAIRSHWYDLVGQWQLYLDSVSRTVSVDFRDDGTFAQRIVPNQGGIQECPGGTWSLEGASVRLAGYVTAGDGTSQSLTWRMVDTPSGLALYGGDGPDAPSFVWTRPGQPITSDYPCQSAFRFLCWTPSMRRPILRAIWKGGRLGAAMGAAAGIAAAIVALWVCENAAPHDSLSIPHLALGILLFSGVLGGIAALFGMVAGAIGFGAIAVASHLRKSRSANHDQPQSPPAADQPNG